MRRFLAFGDSLTEGYHRYGTQFHPYTEQLEILTSRENLRFDFQNEGVSGETTLQMNRRLQKLLTNAQNTNQGFDYISILGGTNDLGDDSESADSIFDRLQEMYTAALQHSPSTILIVVTIPATGLDSSYPDFLAMKQKVNEMILHYYEANKASDRVFLLDLFSAIPYYTAEGSKSSYWDDQIHFNASGYDYFGQLLFDLLIEHFRSHQ